MLPGCYTRAAQLCPTRQRTQLSFLHFFPAASLNHSVVRWVTLVWKNCKVYPTPLNVWDLTLGLQVLSWIVWSSMFYVLCHWCSPFQLSQASNFYVAFNIPGLANRLTLGESIQYVLSFTCACACTYQVYVSTLILLYWNHLTLGESFICIRINLHILQYRLWEASVQT